MFLMFFFFIFIREIKSYNYVKETFDSGVFTNWHVPKKLRPTTQLGKWVVSAGDCFGNQQKWLGLLTTKSHRDYILYTNFTKPMNSIENDLIVQYTVRLNPYADCSGQFIKIMESKSDMARFSQDLPFAIKFGPDLCGPSFRRVHFVITYNGIEYETNHPLGFIKDPFTHSYTLIIRKNNTFSVLLDGDVVDEATLEERFDFKKPIHDKNLNNNQEMKNDNSQNLQESVSSTTESLSESKQIYHEYDENSAGFYDGTNNNNEEIGEEEEEFFMGEQQRNTYDKDKDNYAENDNNNNINNQNTENDDNNESLNINKTNQLNETEEINNATNYNLTNELEDQETLPFGHWDSLGYLGIDVYQNCCGSLFDNFLVTDNEKEAEKMLYENFIRFRVDEARSCDKGHSVGGGDGREDGNDNNFGNKEALMRGLRHKIDYSNFDPL